MEKNKMAPPTHQWKNVSPEKVHQFSVILGFMQYLVAFSGAVFMMLTIKSPSDINTGGTKKETKWNG